MSELHQLWTPIYNDFDPWLPVPPGKMGDWFGERPHSPLPSLRAELDPARVPQRMLLVGHRTNGKSTELIKLAAELAQQFNYFVVRLELEPNVADIDKANPVEVLFLMGAATYKVAQDELENKPDQKLFDALVDSLNTLVREHTENKAFGVDAAGLLKGLVCVGAGLLGGPLAGQVAAQVLERFRFISGTNLETVKKLEVQPRIKQVLDCLNAIIGDVEAKANRPVALLVDGLDKVGLELAYYIFVENPFLAGPACRAMYAAPIIVYYSPRFAPVRARFPIKELPNIKLHERGKPEALDKGGYKFMRAVVRRRLPSPGLIEAKALDKLIAASGGLLRDLIRLVRQATVHAELAGRRRITVKVAEEAIAELRRSYEAVLSPIYRRELEQVRQTNQITGSKECDELLHANLVLSYINRDLWYDAHSVLAEDP